MTRGSIIIAAHNEEAVIARTLDPLVPLAASGEVRVIVVCNGCTDGTADIARLRPGTEVLELVQPSKTAALRAGDAVAVEGPRIYLDADVVLTATAAQDVVEALSTTAIAGRPPHVFDTSGASWVIKSWYRVRESLPSIASALWGAGCYALSEAGRARFDEFPDIVSDDLFIDSIFRPDEVTIVQTDPVVVTTPRRAADLVRILQRSYRTQAEVLASSGASVSQGQRRQLIEIRGLLQRSPQRIIDVAVYMGVIAYARVRARVSRSERGWERDVSSRTAPPTGN